MTVREVASYQAHDGSLYTTFKGAAEKNVSMCAERTMGLLHRRKNVGGCQTQDRELKEAARALVKSLEELHGS